MDVIITGDKVYNCKPHPEPYLNAAKALSVGPLECVVVENAPVGIESAKSAGMYCIAICSTLERRYLEKADMIIDKFADLEKLL
jgi:beta-phosphoglucomutase